MPIYKKVDIDFFKNWTTSMAYVLGFFAADGTMTLTKRGTHFWSINIKDEDLIFKIKKIIKSNHRINKRTHNVSGKETFRLQIGSKEMFNDLEKLGFMRRKKYHMVLPNVPKHLMGDFLRGYFDGDGNVWVGIVNKKRKNPSTVIQTVFTSCSYEFLYSIKEHVKKKVMVDGSIYKIKDKNAYRLGYGVRGSLKLYELMYNVSSQTNGLFLKRKKSVFDRYLKKCSRSSTG